MIKYIKIIFSIGIIFSLSGYVNAQQIKSKNPHSQAHKELLASRAKSSDQIKLIDKNSFIDLIDDIEPEIDIFTEGWNSRSVNPFKESEVPNT